MPKYVLHYFDGRGRAELLRILFAYGNIEYTERRINFANWPEVKPSRLFEVSYKTLIFRDLELFVYV